jgi:hypothetical protein
MMQQDCMEKTCMGKKCKGNNARGLIDLCLMFFLFTLVCYFLANYLDVFSNGFSGSDESSHFVNSFFIWKYLSLMSFGNPMEFAEQFYIAYPKLSIGHWPPLYYFIVSGLFLVFPATPESAAWINLFISALASCGIAYILARTVGIVWGFLGGLTFLLLPLAQEALQFFMLDQPLVIVVLLAAVTWEKFTQKPGFLLGIVYGCLAAAAILIKGNGWVLGLFPLLHILLTRHWRLLVNPRVYVGGVCCLLAVVPWYLVTSKISADGFNYTFGIHYAARALIGNLLTFYHNLGLVGLLLAAAGVILTCRRDHRLASWTRVCLSMIGAVLLLQSLIPVDIVGRYMLPAMPFVVILAIFGLVETCQVLLSFLKARHASQSRLRGKGGVYGAVGLIALLLMWPGLTTLMDAMPQRDMRMAEVSQQVVDAGMPQVVVIDGSPSGEGAFIAEALVTSQASNLYVVRSSKLLSDSNFMGANYALKVSEPAEVGASLRRIGAQHIVVERSKGGSLYPHSGLLGRYLQQPDSGYRLVIELPHRHSQGSTRVFSAEEVFTVDPQTIQAVNFPKKAQAF